MKANYLPKNRSRHLVLKQILALVIILILGSLIFSFLDQTIISAVAPAWKTENALVRSWRNGSAFLRLQKALVAENTALKEKLASLELSIISMSKDRIQENVVLELVGRKQVSNIIVAAVLTHPPQTPYDVIIV